MQYFNHIVGEEERVFPPPYKEIKEPPSGLKYYCTIDPAFTVNKTSDFTAIVVCGYDSGETIYVCEAIKLKCNPSDLIGHIYKLYEKYNLRYIGIESTVMQNVVVWALEYAQKNEDLPSLPVVPINTSNVKDAKDNRIRGMSYFFKRGAVVLKHGLEDLKRELGRYPGNSRSKDDLLDALSMQRELISWRRKV